MSGRRYTTYDVPVAGGVLRVGEWSPDEPAVSANTVIAIHGITAHHRCWPLVADRLPQTRIIAPDLRGRGRSRGLPGPYGMPAHAADLIAVMDALSVERATLLGHSMGGFVSMVTADLYPERVASLVLVDGGFPLEPPAGVKPEQLVQAVLGPAAERLAMSFRDFEAYRDFWREHPAFGPMWSAAAEDYVDYDLAGEVPHMRPSTSLRAVETDASELIGGTSLVEAVARLRHPTKWLLAPRGLLNEVPPLYPVEVRDTWLQRHHLLTAQEVPEVNHYSIVLSPNGADAVSGAVRAAFAESGPPAMH